MTTNTALDPGTAAAIRQALAAAGSGWLLEARRIAEAAISSGGDSAALNALLGVLCLNGREFDAAARHLRIAHELKPTDVMIALNLGTALAELGSFEDALHVVSARLAEMDPSGRLMKLRAFSAQSLGDHAAAAKAYEYVLARAQDDWESWNNLGNSRRSAGDASGAVEALERAVALAPDSPPVRLNFANALHEAGRSAEAEAQLRLLATEFPEDWRSMRELHLMFRSQAREEAALGAIEEASRRSPDDLDLKLAVASQRLLLLDNAGAEEAYSDVVARDPSNADANLGLAVTYEVSNRASDLPRLINEAEARGASNDVLNFIRAFDHRRAKRFKEGIATLSAVTPELESARHAQLLGQLYDGSGDYARAWDAFSRMNEIQRADPSRPEERASAYREAIRRSCTMIDAAWANRWSDVNIDDGRSSPAFLLGFPRSGTTLLDTMLMAHPDVEVLEEEPTLQSPGELLSTCDDLPRAPSDLIAAARDSYFKGVGTKFEMGTKKLIVDKNPLYTIALPMIRRIFPDAKIILALRHPCDVALSCFTTNFKLNDGMSSFLRLDTTAELYDLAFSYFERVQALMPMATHTIFYEKLIASQEDELKALMSFLGLSWDEAVLNHQKMAQERGRIKTASYAQVIEPIYARSSGRWKNYREQLEPVLSVLKPWIDKFGYEV